MALAISHMEMPVAVQLLHIDVVINLFTLLNEMYPHGALRINLRPVRV